jgi:rhodanese-related sulfurtransferase
MAGSSISELKRILDRGFHTQRRRTHVKTFRAHDLEKMMDQKKDLLVLNVLSQDDYDKEHIPGSENVPNDAPDFISQVEKLAGSKTRPMVVHCASTECPASTQAVNKLNAAGFTNVTEFPGGMAEWKSTGHKVRSMSTVDAKHS